MIGYIRERRPGDSLFDVTYSGRTDGDDPAADAITAARFADAGVTWWIEDLNNGRGPVAEQRDRVRKGPPRS